MDREGTEILRMRRLQIVSDELWQRVRDRQEHVRKTYGVREGGGVLIPRSVTSPYLLSGLLKCGLCGADTFKRDNFKDCTLRLMAQVTARNAKPATSVGASLLGRPSQRI